MPAQSSAATLFASEDRANPSPKKTGYLDEPQEGQENAVDLMMMFLTLLWMAYMISAVILSGVAASKFPEGGVNLGWAVVLGAMAANIGITLVAKETRSPVIVCLIMAAVVVAAVIVVRRMPAPPKPGSGQPEQK